MGADNSVVQGKRGNKWGTAVIPSTIKVKFKKTTQKNEGVET